MKYEAWYGPTLVARARSVWGIRHKAKRWCRSRENKLMRRPKLGNLHLVRIEQQGSVVTIPTRRK